MTYYFKELNEIFLKAIVTQIITPAIIFMQEHFSPVLLHSCKKLNSYAIKANKDHIQEITFPA